MGLNTFVWFEIFLGITGVCVSFYFIFRFCTFFGDFLSFLQLELERELELGSLNKYGVMLQDQQDQFFTPFSSFTNSNIMMG